MLVLALEQPLLLRVWIFGCCCVPKCIADTKLYLICIMRIKHDKKYFPLENSGRINNVCFALRSWTYLPVPSKLWYPWWRLVGPGPRGWRRTVWHLWTQPAGCFLFRTRSHQWQSCRHRCCLLSLSGKPLSESIGLLVQVEDWTFF